MQFGGVLSTSHVANNFMGTGLLPPIGGGLLAFSAMFSRTEKNIWRCPGRGPDEWNEIWSCTNKQELFLTFELFIIIFFIAQKFIFHDGKYYIGTVLI